MVDDRFDRDRDPKLSKGSQIPSLRRRDLEIYRRNLPHWRLPSAVYFVTWRLHPDQTEMGWRQAGRLLPCERSLLRDTLLYFQHERYLLFAYVVMDDHAHAIVQPFDERWSLSNVIHSWKSYSANVMRREHGREGRVWQDEYFDRVIRNESDYREKLRYIVDNPRKRWPELRTPYEWCGVTASIDEIGR
ncbi:MAG: transposase [Phycisphaerales bacterium]